MRKATDEQILSFIREFIAENGYSPSFREIAKGVGLSSAAVVKGRLERLRRLKKVDYKDGMPRTVRPL